MTRPMTQAEFDAMTDEEREAFIARRDEDIRREERFQRERDFQEATANDFPLSRA